MTPKDERGTQSDASVYCDDDEDDSTRPVNLVSVCEEEVMIYTSMKSCNDRTKAYFQGVSSFQSSLSLF